MCLCSENHESMDPKTTMRNRKEKAKSAKKSPSVEGESSGPPKAQKAEEVKKAESKLKKILTRTFFGALMIGVFAGLIYAGHLYVCLLVLLIQVLLFPLLQPFAGRICLHVPYYA